MSLQPCFTRQALPLLPVFLETGHLVHSGAVGLERQLGWGSQVALCKRLVSQVCLSLHLQCPPPTCHLPPLTASINSVLPASRILPKNYKTKQKQPSQVWDTGGWQIQASQTGRRRAPSSLSVPENLGISNDGKAWEMKTSPSQTMSTQGGEGEEGQLLAGTRGASREVVNGQQQLRTDISGTISIQHPQNTGVTTAAQ